MFPLWSPIRGDLLIEKIQKYMKRLFSIFRPYGCLPIAAAMVSGMLISCSGNDDTPIDDAGRLIRFAVVPAEGWQTPQSRSGAAVPVSADGRMSIVRDDRDYVASRSVTTTDNIESAGVFAAYIADISSTPAERTPSYMYNVEVTRADGWTPSGEYRWPVTTVNSKTTAGLHINAYSPYAASSDATVKQLPAADSTGDLKLIYSTPADVSEQQDLLWATPCNANTSPCTLTFNHALAAVGFATGSAMSPCKVISIRISGVQSEGTLNLETGEWSGTGVPVDFVARPGITLEAADGSALVASDTPITDSDNTFLFIPQTLSDGATVTVTVESGGVQTELTASLSGQQWYAGRTVVYHISATL